VSEAGIRKLKKEALLAKMDADRAVLTTQIRLAEAPKPHRTDNLLSPNALSVVSKYGYLLSAAVAGLGVLGPKLLMKLLKLAFRRLVQIVTGAVIQKVTAPKARLPKRRRR
jgi:hypothetical protein